MGVGWGGGGLSNVGSPGRVVHSSQSQVPRTGEQLPPDAACAPRCVPAVRAGASCGGPGRGGPRGSRPAGPPWLGASAGPPACAGRGGGRRDAGRHAGDHARSSARWRGLFARRHLGRSHRGAPAAGRHVAAAAAAARGPSLWRSIPAACAGSRGRSRQRACCACSAADGCRGCRGGGAARRRRRRRRARRPCRWCPHAGGSGLSGGASGGANSGRGVRRRRHGHICCGGQRGGHPASFGRTGQAAGAAAARWERAPRFLVQACWRCARYAGRCDSLNAGTPGCCRA